MVAREDGVDKSPLAPPFPLKPAAWMIESRLRSSGWIDQSAFPISLQQWIGLRVRYIRSVGANPSCLVRQIHISYGPMVFVGGEVRSEEVQVGDGVLVLLFKIRSCVGALET